MNSHTRGTHKMLTDACWGRVRRRRRRQRVRGCGGGRAANSEINACTCSPPEQPHGKTTRKNRHDPQREHVHGAKLWGVCQPLGVSLLNASPLRQLRGESVDANALKCGRGQLMLKTRIHEVHKRIMYKHIQINAKTDKHRHTIETNVKSSARTPAGTV